MEDDSCNIGKDEIQKIWAGQEKPIESTETFLYSPRRIIIYHRRMSWILINNLYIYSSQMQI